MNDKDYMKEDWFAVLKEEVEKNGTAKTAAKLRYSMTSISLILNGKYSGKPDRVAAKVREVFRKVMCPFENRRMDRTECIEIALAPAPTHNPIKMQHWRSCQKCEIRPCEKRKRPSENKKG